MDDLNIININSDLDSLENDYKNWLSLTHYERRRSDEECLKKYGCTNIELYNKYKATLISNISTTPQAVTETTNILESIKLDDKEEDKLSKESLYYKMLLSKVLSNNDPNIIIISDFPDDQPLYDLNSLQELLNKYYILPQSHKDFSDNYSIMIWGATVPFMYRIIKSKIEDLNEKNKKEKELKISVIDKSLSTYENTIIESVRNNDPIDICYRKLDCLIGNNKLSLYESSVLESFINIFESDIYKDNNIPMNYINPILSYNEYMELNPDSDISFYEYAYELAQDQKSYYRTILELQSKLKNCNADEKENIEKSIYEMGWNPYIPINGESIKFAKNKMRSYLLMDESKIKICDISNWDTKLSDEALNEDYYEENKRLEPIYLVLSFTGSPFSKIVTKFTKTKYGHAGMSLDSSLQKIYTYAIDNSRNINGIKIENLDDYKIYTGNATIKVLVIFVTPETKKHIVQILNFLEENSNKTRYNIKNIFKIVAHKSDDKLTLSMVCSQFVDTVLKLCKIDLTGKSSNLVIPSDFEKTLDTINIFTLFEGKESEYNSRQIDRKVKALMKQVDYNDIIVNKPQMIIKKISEHLIENCNICSEDDKINKVLKELRYYMTPKCAIVESKLPIGFKKSGNLYIVAPKDLQAEYNEAHKLLYMYDQSNVEGIKHELARLFFLNSIIEKKIKKMKKKDNNYKELIDLRARIMNDFTTYFKVVKHVEPKFDFSEYIKNTEYYNKEIEIDSSTLKYSGSLIKSILSKMTK